MTSTTSFRRAVLSVAMLAATTAAHAQPTCSTLDTFQMAPGQPSAYSTFARNSRGGMFVAGVANDGLGSGHWLFKAARGQGQMAQLAWKTMDDFAAFPGAVGMSNVLSVVFDAKDDVLESGFASDGRSTHWLVRKLVYDPNTDSLKPTLLDNFQLAPGQDARAQNVVVNPRTGTVLVGGWARDANGVAHGILRQAIPWNGQILWYTLSDFQLAKGKDTYLFNLSMSATGKAYATYTATDALGASHWLIKSLESASFSLVGVLDSTGQNGRGASGYATTVDRAGNVLSAGLYLGAAARWTVKNVGANGASTDIDSYLYNPEQPYAWQSAVPVSIVADPNSGDVYTAGVVRDVTGRSHAVVRRGASYPGSYVTLDDFQLVARQDAGAMQAVVDAMGGAHIMGFASDGVSTVAVHRYCR